MSGRGFDAFGKPREEGWQDSDHHNGTSEPGDLNRNDLSTRGFTGHEHLNETDLIHMNGRVYDYNLGRFLSVDPFIQFPANSQSMNAYSYIMNNPLSGTDPSGYAVNSAIQECRTSSGGCGVSVGQNANLSGQLLGGLGTSALAHNGTNGNGVSSASTAGDDMTSAEGKLAPESRSSQNNDDSAKDDNVGYEQHRVNAKVGGGDVSVGAADLLPSSSDSGLFYSDSKSWTEEEVVAINQQLSQEAGIAKREASLAGTSRRVLPDVRKALIEVFGSVENRGKVADAFSEAGRILSKLDARDVNPLTESFAKEYDVGVDTEALEFKGDIYLSQRYVNGLLSGTNRSNSTLIHEALHVINFSHPEVGEGGSGIRTVKSIRKNRKDSARSKLYSNPYAYDYYLEIRHNQ